MSGRERTPESWWRRLLPRGGEGWGMVCWLAIVVVLTGPVAAMACPNCKGTLEDGANAGSAGLNMVRGYYYSILFMMSMPFLLTGFLVFAIRRQTGKSLPQPERFLS